MLIDFSPGQNRRQFEHVPLTDRYMDFFNGIAERVAAKHGYSSIFRTNDAWQAEGGGRLTPEIRERFRGPLERNWENSRNIFENHFLAVNVANVAWGSWAYLPRFGWKGASEEMLKKWEK